jgi:hypothetical protein
MKDVIPCQIDAVEGENNTNTYENLDVIVE